MYPFSTLIGSLGCQDTNVLHLSLMSFLTLYFYRGSRKIATFMKIKFYLFGRINYRFLPRFLLIAWKFDFAPNCRYLFRNSFWCQVTLGWDLGLLKIKNCFIYVYGGYIHKIYYISFWYSYSMMKYE